MCHYTSISYKLEIIDSREIFHPNFKMARVWNFLKSYVVVLG